MMEHNVSTSSLVDSARLQLQSAGLAGYEEVSGVPESPSFGDAVVIFRLGSLLIRFARERGQVFVDVAAASEPKTFHQFDDVDIAMGWKSVDQVLAKKEPENIRFVLARVRANLEVLNKAFSGDIERLTRVRVERAAKDRGQAFTSKLRGKR